MEILRAVLILIQFVVFVYFLLSTFYLMLFSVAGLFYKDNKTSTIGEFRRFAVMIPGYKEDVVIVSVANQALNQNYPKDKFEVIIIADSFEKETLDKLKQLPIHVIVVEFEESNKSRSLNRCMQEIGDDYDVAFVLDADNIMDVNVLQRMNVSFELGYLAVQGHRTAKNLNTNFAILDAISEEINNHIFRKAHRVLGISSALIGSGMGIDYGLYKKVMFHVDSMGGCEDKEVELNIIKNKIPIHYLHDALIYDEKTQKSSAFVNQRRRWIACQFNNFVRHFFDALKALIINGNVDYFDKVFQMVPPPRMILVGTLFVLSTFYFVISLIPINSLHLWFAPRFSYWIILFIITTVSLFLSIPKKFYNKRTFRALFSIPLGFILMVLSLLRMKGAHKSWLHTTHNYSEDPKEKA